MNFTSTLPTQPGFYAWKQIESDSPIAVNLRWFTCPGNQAFTDYLKDPIHDIEPSDARGLWCRLVPAEEVEKAWKEGWVKGNNAGPFESSSHASEQRDFDLHHSRAKLVAEELE
jgi:hypothetical protein